MFNKNEMKKLNKKGFTLIEIIVVVVILSVLMTVVAPSVLKYVNVADDAKYYAEARTLFMEYETELVKLAVKNGGKISIKDAKKVETSIKDNYSQGNLGELYGVKISSSDNPKNFDSDWITKDGVDGYFSLYDVKSYLIAFVNVGNGYSSYHLLVMPNNKIEIVKNK